MGFGVAPEHIPLATRGMCGLMTTRLLLVADWTLSLCKVMCCRGMQSVYPSLIGKPNRFRHRTLSSHVHSVNRRFTQ
ncbi:hypothetical protein B0T24DRAFT_633455 [Lasiosphaeria ovina]|uniref:Secreted protein n=1 Tax=Lasiosphaeria ovina TaxID=92902 RepID=A0AAE0N1I7_9PEZI|nr:hypothetical protein B0T24DRAFT_633455 [Lasiosphaeria ovina]